MATQRQKTITEYMNALCTDRQFKPLEIQLIGSAIQKEKFTRTEKLNYKTNAGRLAINIATAKIVNEIVKPPIKSEHVRLYKQCNAQEYMDRTGKCAWGFENRMIQMGYDPKTRMEVE